MVRLKHLVALVFAFAGTPALALTSLVYDIEPNNAPHQAIDLEPPADRNSLRVLGELTRNDQDAYRLIIDEDLAGRLFNLSLTGRAGALTKVDVFDFTDIADGRGRIPDALDSRPTSLMAVGAGDGMRTVQRDALLFAPGVYVLGVSHSGGEGSYTLELSENEEYRVDVLSGQQGSDTDPVVISPGRGEVVWTQGETWYRFEIEESEEPAAYAIEFQTPLGRTASLALYGAAEDPLLELESPGGVPVRRAGLQLEPGEYRLRTEQMEAGVQVVQLPRSAPPVTDGRETEPNDRVPTPIAFGVPVAGRFDDGDRDLLAFEVDAEAAGRRFDLAVQAGTESNVELCILRASIDLSQCYRGPGGRTIVRSLGLAEGRYEIRLSDRGPSGAEWRLTWTDRGERRAGEEIEPNDTHEHAVALHEQGFGRGAFENDTGRESDHWRLSVSGEPQLWRLQLQGDNLFEIELKDGSGDVIASTRASGEQRIRLDNLFLMPGEYTVNAQGESGDYMLRALPLGPPPPGMEMEPNDEIADARQMRFGQTYTGTLAEKGDSDRYRFTLLGSERIRLTVQPPADGGIRGYLGLGDEAVTLDEIRHGNRVGEALVWDVFLPPGDYHLWLRPGQVSVAEYTVLLERLDWLDRIADREPNDYAGDAAPFPPDGRIVGKVGGSVPAGDWYRLPRVDVAVDLAWTEPDGVRTEVFAAGALDEDQAQYDRASDLHNMRLEPGADYLLHVSGNGEYTLDFSALAGNPEGEAAAPELSMSLAVDSIQAFSEWAQSLDGELVVRNSATVPRDIDLRTHLTDARWQIEGLPDSLSLAAGEVRNLPFEVRVAPDAVTHSSTRISAVAGSDHADSAVVSVEVVADLDAAAVRPTFYWPLDPPLRGGLNAAASRFGAAPVASPGLDDDELEDVARLLDGMARYGRWTGLGIPTPRDPERNPWGQPTVRLAGTSPVPVRGFLLNPTSNHSPDRYLGEFEVAVSLDGQSFQTVLRGELLSTAEEQAFVLPEAVLARYVRLIPIGSAWHDADGHGTVQLGQFKVVAEAGWRPMSEPFNLADPANGGHLVHASPWIRGSGFDTGVLIDDDQAPAPRVRGDAMASLVIGFEHRRAASIDRIEIDPMRPDEANPKRVRIFGSDQTPLGPWEPLASADLADEVVSIALAEPVWARYVRLVFDLPDGAGEARFPDRIAVYEDEGPSVLGEWGYLAGAGPYEQTNPPIWSAAAGKPKHDAPERALPLIAGEPAPGRALLDAYSSWYQVDVPDGQNKVTLSVSGWPTVEAEARLMNEAGEEVGLYRLREDGTPDRLTWEAWVEPGQRYLLEVAEPPRSVIFSWDTSGSVASFLPTISNALFTYAETIKPGRDEVNLLPFGQGRPLLADWVGQPYPLMRMLVGYPAETSSSAAEATLAVAAREMRDRPGKKAVLLLTDAATNTSPDLWPALEAGRPQVFAMKLSSEGGLSSNPPAEVDLMQDWAQVRNGHFEYVTGLGVLARGFDRAVARLKRPVDFSIVADFARVEDPSPASVVVNFGQADASTEATRRGAVQIILDASGSMLKRMDGSRRIDVAKAAIRSVITEALPSGLPLALRVYGHREAGSCRTDLEIPAEPLDKQTFLARVDEIEAINLAKTPIADSLGAVARDLAGIDGRKLVLLLTDGEETCDGDPAEAIAELQASGTDVRVNIVGFAIDDDSLKQQFARWAELGGGEYLDAADAEALGKALEAALKVPFGVIDEAGIEVARGFVGGEALEVPPGQYSIRVDTARPFIERGVSLAPGGRHELVVE